jgi:hypothetical protein
MYVLTEPAQLERGILRVVQTPGAVYNATIGQWALTLQCGHFVSLGNPPLTMQWQVGLQEYFIRSGVVQL